MPKKTLEQQSNAFEEPLCGTCEVDHFCAAFCSESGGKILHDYVYVALLCVCVDFKKHRDDAGNVQKQCWL